MLASVE